MLQQGLLLQNRYRVIRPLGEGGMAQTFEVDDRGVTKVLKVLQHNEPDLVALLQREARVLSQIQHPGVPRVESEDGYFCFYLEDNPNPFHCLIMEKIPGLTLKQWLETRAEKPISQTQAMDWLKQLAEILEQIHQQQFFHRDITPRNIILKPDGQLVLIDFGIVREVTETYRRKQQENLTGTNYGSYGYAPWEQLEGKAVLQSDFFALGRTFVHLVTGCSPNDLPKGTKSGKLLWRNRASDISKELADLLDWLVEPTIQDRPQTAKEILKAIEIIEHRANAKLLWRQLPFVCLWSGVVAGIIIGIRFLGLLQPTELLAYDLMMRSRPAEPPDPRLLLITIDEADIEWQEEEGMERTVDDQSLFDEALLKLLIKLEQYQPRVIGLDIYRDFPVHSDSSDGLELVKRLGEGDRLIAVCKAPIENRPATNPPPEASQVGFSDFVGSPAAILRIHLLMMDSPEASECNAHFAFSTLIALRYLYNEGIRDEYTSDSKPDLKLNNVIFHSLKAHSGAYQGIDSGGSQILLNYRSLPPSQIAQQISLRDFLTTPVDPNLIKDRIVLIGAMQDADYWRTPMSPNFSKDTPGVVIHAHMVSQLISAVLDERPLLWFWKQRGEALWIMSWSFFGGILAWGFRVRWHLLLFEGVVIIILSGVCFVVLTVGGWLPLIPPVLAIVIASLGIAYITSNLSLSNKILHKHGL